MQSNIEIFENTEETARSIAELILEKSNEKVKRSLPFNIAVSGGNTPKTLFEILVNEFSDKISWHVIRLFWADERCVPPTHAESNFGLTYESLLKHVPISETNIFRMQGEADPEVEAIRYGGLIEKELPTVKSLPRFDLILLGMGDDGHTASIFPDNLQLLDSERIVSTSIHPANGQKRITLTGQTLNNGENVLFFITGKTKAHVLKQILNKTGDFQKFPASYIHSSSTEAAFYLDKYAASDYLSDRLERSDG